MTSLNILSRLKTGFEHDRSVYTFNPKCLKITNGVKVFKRITSDLKGNLEGPRGFTWKVSRGFGTSTSKTAIVTVTTASRDPTLAVSGRPHRRPRGASSQGLSGSVFGEVRPVDGADLGTGFLQNCHFPKSSYWSKETKAASPAQCPPPHLPCANQVICNIFPDRTIERGPFPNSSNHVWLWGPNIRRKR